MHRAKIAQPRVRMEGWRQRRPGSNARNPQEGKRKQKEKNTLDSYRPSHGRSYQFITEKMSGIRFWLAIFSLKWWARAFAAHWWQYLAIARSPICWESGHTKWANLWFVRLIGLLCVLLPALPLHLLLRLRSVFSRLLVLSLCCCGADYEAREGEGKAKHSFANENVQSHFCLSPS